MSNRIVFGNGRNSHTPPSRAAAPAPNTHEEATMNTTPQKPILARHPETVAAIEAGGRSAISAFMDRVAATYRRNKKAQAAAKHRRVVAAAQQRVAAKKAAADDALYARMFEGAPDVQQVQPVSLDKPLTDAEANELYTKMYGTDGGVK